MNYIQKSLRQSRRAHRVMMRSFLVFVLLFVISYSLFVTPVAAQEGIGQLGLEYGTATGLGTRDIRVTVARIIQVFLGLLGTVAVALVVYGGYLWMTSAGNEEKITQAKELLTNAGIGLVIILLAFSIVQFVVSRLIAATTGVGLGAGGGGGVTSISLLSNSLGSGIIREHYPVRDAREIPRNVKMIVTFKDPVSIPSIIKNYDDKGTPEVLSDDVAEKNTNGTPDNTADDYFESKASAIQIYPSEGGRDDALTENQVRVDFTPDLKIWVFDPLPLLGSPSEKIFYTVELGGGNEGIRKTNGDLAFSGVYSDGYTWEFQVSTFVDNTPPKVISVIPLTERECFVQAGGKCARNVIITINFDEAIDPTTVSGAIPGFTNIRVDSNGDAEGGEVAGTFVVANQYRTVEFTPSLRCGTNSCGGDVFCLPADSGITTTVRAATLGAEPPGAAFPYPFDGVTDAVGNSLNGDNDASAEGPPADNHSWIFPTSGLIDLTPPSIISIEPSPNTENVNADLPLSLAFSELMRVSTLSNEAVALRGANAAFQFDPAVTPWYGLWSQSILWPSRTPLEAVPPQDAALINALIVTQSEIRHGTFMVNTSYYPEMTSRVQDLYQNCLFPPNQSAPESLQCNTTTDKPFCCFAPAGITEGSGGGIGGGSAVVRGIACASPCVLGASGNAVCQE